MYYLLISLAFLSVVLSVWLGYLKPWALISLVLFLPAIKAAGILKKNSCDKLKLMESSRLTIAVQTLVNVFLIICLKA